MLQISCFFQEKTSKNAEKGHFEIYNKWLFVTGQQKSRNDPGNCPQN